MLMMMMMMLSESMAEDVMSDEDDDVLRVSIPPVTRNESRPIAPFQNWRGSALTQTWIDSNILHDAESFHDKCTRTTLYSYFVLSLLHFEQGNNTFGCIHGIDYTNIQLERIVGVELARKVIDPL